MLQLLHHFVASLSLHKALGFAIMGQRAKRITQESHVTSQIAKIRFLFKRARPKTMVVSISLYPLA
jgi:hypothetical protein